jgi:hypothetical protein
MARNEAHLGPRAVCGDVGKQMVKFGRIRSGKALRIEGFAGVCGIRIREAQPPRRGIGRGSSIPKFRLLPCSASLERFARKSPRESWQGKESDLRELR